MDNFTDACTNFTRYPENVVQHDMLTHILHSYSEKLRQRMEYLFDEETVAVDFLELRDQKTGQLPTPTLYLSRPKLIYRRMPKHMREKSARIAIEISLYHADSCTRGP